MRKVCDLIVTIFFVVLLVGPFGLYVAEKIGINLPASFTSKGAEYLTGESGEPNSKEINVRATFSLGGFVSKSLQSAVETELACHIPAKSAALIGYAAMQRCTIHLSNIFFSWECYPTFYGSSQIFIPSQRALAFLPERYSDQYYNDLRKAAKAIANFQNSNPEKQIVLYIVQGKETPQFNPAYSLMSEPISGEIAFDVVREAVGEESKVILCTDHYESISAYYEHFFKSDHHWSIRGAIDAYNTMAVEVGLPIHESDGWKRLGDLPSYGSSARVGLDLIPDYAFDDVTDYSSLYVYKSDNTIEEYNHDSYYDSSDLRKMFRFYDSYYAELLDGDGLLNLKNSDKKTALLLSNSYGGALRCLIASQYHKTKICNHLYASGGGVRTRDSRLSELIKISDDTEADAIFIVVNPHDLVSTIRACPHFFD